MDAVVDAGCDSSCKSQILCPIATNNYADQSHCKGITKRLQSQRLLNRKQFRR